MRPKTPNNRSRTSNANLTKAGTRSGLLSIGVFASRSRLSLKALRLYDRLGLLKPAQVDLISGYRRYSEKQLAVARLIVMLRRLNVPLAGVARMISAPAPRAAELLQSFWDARERQLAAQRELALYVRGKLLGHDGISSLAIRQREMPEQLVLAERQRVQVDELPRWIGAAMARLARLARRYGGAAGAPFVVYHGEINEDCDGPAEACVPIPFTRGSPRDTLIRREPAHREAYIRIRKAQVGFPQIVSVYDQLTIWAARQGVIPSGPPREIYFGDFVAAHPDEEVCDVALPIP